VCDKQQNNNDKINITLGTDTNGDGSCLWSTTETSTRTNHGIQDGICEGPLEQRRLTIIKRWNDLWGQGGKFVFFNPQEFLKTATVANGYGSGRVPAF